jgi:hypothetical protein
MKQNTVPLLLAHGYAASLRKRSHQPLASIGDFTISHRGGFVPMKNSQIAQWLDRIPSP